jgi:hypothetical protein
MSNISNADVPTGPGPKNPVRVLGAVIGALVALVGANEWAHVIPSPYAGWVAIAVGAIAYGWAEYTRTKVTPLAAPKAIDGVTPLVPLSAVQVPPSTHPSKLRADKLPYRIAT